jgi:hypothetical protein
VVFFPTARYRLPAAALLLPYAAALVVLLWDRWRSGEGWRAGMRAVPPAAVVAAVSLVVLVNVAATNVFRHLSRDRAEHLYYGARWAMQQLAIADSAELEARLAQQANEAMRIDPSYPEPVELLAMYYSVRDPARAGALFDRLGELAPDDPKIRRLLQEMRREPGS